MNRIAKSSWTTQEQWAVTSLERLGALFSKSGENHNLAWRPSNKVAFANGLPLFDEILEKEPLNAFIFS
ncbi:hypothetical protein EFA69_13565 [Rufibacter immobilis]|uniref:Uncharacterized protein n=1 Tax=Rufibacter immobilis TaxID=1348778 RepID=A0A3M9MNU4_9BACT|nr:hypothetical protein [Rufibacter immobilis]RNI27189.1 hypothetical protein EFA69_13565 [Rufibacter immobilis]